MVLECFRRMTTACDAFVVCVYINSIYSVSLQPGTLSLMNDEFISLFTLVSPLVVMRAPAVKVSVVCVFSCHNALFHVIQFRQLQHGCEIDFRLLQVRS